MKTILVGLAAVALIGGGGFGAYSYFMKPAEASTTNKGDGHSEKNQKQAKKDKNKSDKYEFVELDPLILPIIDENGVSQVLSIIVAVEVADSKGVSKVESLSPRLKDAYIQQMYGMLNKHAAMKGGVIQVEMIKNKLNKISSKVLGDDVVQDVLLQVVQQRPI